MFGRKKKAPEPIYDVTQKTVKTWLGGTKTVPTTKAEQKTMKAEILKRNPKAVVLDSKAKKQKELESFTRFIAGRFSNHLENKNDRCGSTPQRF